ncbi:hypothetical protein [Fibrella aquatilis]|uniref:Uncharacterized protein n=1 Tax=Fibrella aquatilis TaxID=2817059 RepID=A0A939G8R3_9BACT|nr:hypothetical protein [Fibrella aquatilis]MBO0933931.1 hypothetical protein [Fibrella aquatilis]
MKKFWLNEVAYQVAESWSECNQVQLVQGLMLQLRYQADTNPALLANWQVLLLRLLSTAPATLFNQLTGEQLQRLLPYVEWALSERVTSRPFDSFQVDGVDYVLPADELANTSAIELAMASIYYLQYARPQQPNMQAAYLLVTTLCRPRRADHEAWSTSTDFNGDLREEYNSILAENRAKQFEPIPFGVIMAVVQYWESMYTRFLKRYGEVFGEADEQAKPLYPAGEGWIAALEDVAVIGAHGPFKAVCAENCHTIFLFLKHRVAQQQRAEEDAELERERNNAD